MPVCSLVHICYKCRNFYRKKEICKHFLKKINFFGAKKTKNTKKQAHFFAFLVRKSMTYCFKKNC